MRCCAVATEIFRRRNEIKARAAVLVQAMLRRRIARKRVAETAQLVIQKFKDPSTGLPYWYNPKTETTTWYKPALLREKVRVCATDSVLRCATCGY